MYSHLSPCATGHVTRGGLVSCISHDKQSNKYKSALFFDAIMCFLLHRILGTPTNAVWPGVQELPDFKPSFPNWIGKPLIQVIPKLGAQGCDALKVFTLN